MAHNDDYFGNEEKDSLLKHPVVIIFGVIVLGAGVTVAYKASPGHSSPQLKQEIVMIHLPPPPRLRPHLLRHRLRARRSRKWRYNSR